MGKDIDEISARIPVARRTSPHAVLLIENDTLLSQYGACSGMGDAIS